LLRGKDGSCSMKIRRYSTMRWSQRHAASTASFSSRRMAISTALRPSSRVFVMLRHGRRQPTRDG